MRLTVLCPTCRKPLRVPPEKREISGLKARCGGCATVFVVAEASIAPMAFAPAPAPAQPRLPAAAASPVPAPAALPSSAKPTPAPRSPATVAPAAPAPERARVRSTPRGARASAGAWQRCVNHASRDSDAVCSQCQRGWCPECVRRHGTAAICPSCDALCVTSAEQRGREDQARRRSRPLRDELGTVFVYPFSDPVAYLLLAVFVGLFALAASFAAFGAGIAIAISQGLLFAYAFTAINRVSAGDLQGFLPNLGDVADIVEPFRVGIAALLISSGPLIALAFLHPPQDVLRSLGAPDAAAIVAQPTPVPEPSLSPELAALLEEPLEAEEAAGADPEPAEPAYEAYDEPGMPVWVPAAFALALAWQLVYAPIALVAGAISRSFLATLNPLAGLRAIGAMGSVYWTAMLGYTGIALAAALAGVAVGLVPFVGPFLNAFVQSYAFLAIGCLLGLAVFKKAPELGLD